jgi:hypothetical protein
MKKSLEELNNLWEQFSNTPVDDDGSIYEEFNGFPQGTNREDIWYWFEEQHPLFSVAEKLGC